MDIFKELITALSPMLKKMGLNKKGNSFYLEVDKNYGVINFQKSRDSTKEVVLFTINFGVYSNTLGQLQPCYNKSKPEVEQCHWQSRIGYFMPGSPDYWWRINISNDLDDIIANVVEVVQRIIMPEINKRLSDDGLIYCWMNESYAGTTEICRFKYLTTLLKEKGDFKALNKVVEIFMLESKGTPNNIMAIEHLKIIGYNKPD